MELYRFIRTYLIYIQSSFSWKPGSGREPVDVKRSFVCREFPSLFKFKIEFPALEAVSARRRKSISSRSFPGRNSHKKYISGSSSSRKRPDVNHSTSRYLSKMSCHIESRLNFSSSAGRLLRARAAIRQDMAAKMVPS